MSADQWQDLTLEREVLADAVIYRRGPEYRLRLTRADFADEQHAILFDALGALIAAGIEPDYGSLRGVLADRSALTPTVEAALNDVLRGGAVGVNVERSSDRLRELALRRQRRAAVKRHLDAFDIDPALADESVSERIANDLLTVESVAVGRRRRVFISAAHAIEEWLTMPTRSARALPLGLLPSINRVMRGGVEPGEAFFLLARPGSLKTMLLLNLLRTWLLRGTNDLFVLVELEMPQRQLIERLVRQILQIDGESLDQLRQSGSVDVARVRAHLDGLVIVDDVGLSLSDVERRVRLVIQQHQDRPLGGVLIDHVGLLRATSGTSAYDRATETAIGVKQLARRLETPVTAVVQATRAAAQAARDGRPPEMEHARDSGAWEENADFLLSLSDMQPTPMPHVKARLAKNRNGANWNCDIGFDAYSLRMAEVSPTGEWMHG